MKMEASKNPMVEPQYLDKIPKAKIVLAGKVLVFGSGQLTHERRFFDFSKVTEVVLYDPLRETSCPSLRCDHPPHYYELNEALKHRMFDAVLCLFSLHYEPQWLFTLEKVLKHLKPRRTIYFAEDKGFRALLDNNSSFEVLQYNVPNKDLGEIISTAFRQRETKKGAHWLPDISASDYDLVFEILSLVGERTERHCYTLERDYDAANEPNCYLPWNLDANPALTLDFLVQLKGRLPQKRKVTEVVKITGFRKDRDFLDLHNVDNDLTRTVWHCVSRRASERIGKVRALAPAEKPEEASKHREQFAKTFLHTAYLNFFRHFGSIRTAEVVIGFHSNFGSDNVDHDLTFDPHLPPCVFSSSDRQLSMKYETPEFLARYISERKTAASGEKQPKFVAHELCHRGTSGMFLWGPPQDSCWWPDRKDTLSVRTYFSSLVDLREKPRSPENDELFNVFVKWHVPLCLYMLGSLGYANTTRDGLASKEKIAAACVVYFFQNPDYSSDPDVHFPVGYNARLMDDVDVLIFAAHGIISPLAGLSAYLELAHKEDLLQTILSKNKAALKEAKQTMAATQAESVDWKQYSLKSKHHNKGELYKDGALVKKLNPNRTRALKCLLEIHLKGESSVEGCEWEEAYFGGNTKSESFRFSKLFRNSGLWGTVIKSEHMKNGVIDKGPYYLDCAWESK